MATPSRGPGPRAWLAACAGGALAALATALVLAPAQWAATGVERISGGRVELAEAMGSVWNGSAILVLTAANGSPHSRSSLPDPLSWQLNPWPLLTGTIELTLRHPAALPEPLVIRIHAGGETQIFASTLRLPAALLVGLGAPWNTVRPGGVVSLTTDGLHLSRGRCSGSLSAEWEYASSALTPVSPIGHYRVLTSGQYPGTRVELQTLAGPLELTGSGTISEGGHLRFEGIARPLAAADPATKTQLTGLISLLGRRQDDAAILSFGS